MELGQLIEYNNKNTFLQKSWGNEAWSLRPLFIFKKSLIRGERKWSAA